MLLSLLLRSLSLKQTSSVLSGEIVMNVNGHNALKVKRKISPDYRKDNECTIIHPKTGLNVTLPTEVIKMLRNGEARFK